MTLIQCYWSMQWHEAVDYKGDCLFWRPQFSQGWNRDELVCIPSVVLNTSSRLWPFVMQWRRWQVTRASDKHQKSWHLFERYMCLIHMANYMCLLRSSWTENFS
jgi:hypothetical protein